MKWHWVGLLTLPTRFSADPATGSGPCFLSLGLLGTDLDMPCGAAAEEESPFAEISYSLSQLTNSIIIPLVRAWYNKLPLDALRYFLGMVLCGASGHEKGLFECFINVPHAQQLTCCPSWKGNSPENIQLNLFHDRTSHIL